MQTLQQNLRARPGHVATLEAISALLSGQAVPIVTPVAWLVVTGGVAAIALRRMGRLEL